MDEIKPTVLFGLVTVGLSEVLRRQFTVAFGWEPGHTLWYLLLVLAAFLTVSAACANVAPPVAAPPAVLVAGGGDG